MGGESGSSNLILVERWCRNGGGHGTLQLNPYRSRSSETPSDMSLSSETSSNDSDMSQTTDGQTAPAMHRGRGHGRRESRHESNHCGA